MLDTFVAEKDGRGGSDREPVVYAGDGEEARRLVHNCDIVVEIDEPQSAQHGVAVNRLLLRVTVAWGAKRGEGGDGR